MSYRPLSAELAELERTDPVVASATAALDRLADPLFSPLGRTHRAPCRDRTCQWHHLEEQPVTVPDPTSPDCEVRKHDACSGDAWDKLKDAPAACTCDCHRKSR